MARFRYDGREFDLVTPNVGETRWAERQLGQGVSSWTDAEKLYAMAMLSLRRAKVMVTWADVEAWDLDAVEVIEEDEPGAEDQEDEVPTTAGAEAGESEPSGSDETSTSST